MQWENSMVNNTGQIVPWHIPVVTLLMSKHRGFPETFGLMNKGYRM